MLNFQITSPPTARTHWKRSSWEVNQRGHEWWHTYQNQERKYRYVQTLYSWKTTSHPLSESITQLIDRTTWPYPLWSTWTTSSNCIRVPLLGNIHWRLQPIQTSILTKEEKRNISRFSLQIHCSTKVRIYDRYGSFYFYIFIARLMEGKDCYFGRMTKKSVRI